MSQTMLPSATACALDEKASKADSGAVLAASSSRRLRWLLGVGLAALTVAVFFPSVRNDFVEWDDGHQIFNNPHLGLGWENLKWMFTDYERVNRYLPLGWLSYSVDRALFGGGPLSYHVGNLLLHTLNTVLVFALLRRLFERAGQRSAWPQAAGENADVPNETAGRLRGTAVDVAAAFGALWWAVNPLRVEVVAWSSGRIYLVAIAFMLLSILCYLRSSEQAATRLNRWLLLSALFYTFSLFTYPLALCGLAVFLTLDVYPLRRLPSWPRGWIAPDARRVLAEKALFLLPAVLMLAITLWTRTGNATLGAIVDADRPNWIARGMQSLYVWAYYVWKPWSPVHLAPEYATLLEFNPWSAPFLISAAMVIGLSFWFWNQRRARPVLLAVWVIHLVLLIPMLGMESFQHYHTTDRYSYLQGIGWSVAVGAAVFWAVQRPRWRVAIPVGLLVWVGFCAALIPGQISIWKDSLSLHSRIVESLARNPDQRTGSRALRDWARHESFLGQLQMQRKDFAAAEASFRHACATDPTLAEPAMLLGELLASHGRNAEAIACLETALRAHPADVRGRMVLAVVLGQSGNLAESARHFEEAVRLAPRDASARHNYAVTLERLGNTNAATEHYARAAELRARETTSR